MRKLFEWFDEWHNTNVAGDFIASILFIALYISIMAMLISVIIDGVGKILENL